MSTPILRVRDLQVAFARDDASSVPVLRGVDFEISEGEFVALVGESGSGKSTVVNAVAGLVGSSARVTGSAELLGTDLVSLAPEKLRRKRGCEVGLVFQNPMSALNPCHRIMRQVAEAVRAHQRVSRTSAEQRALQLLGEVQLPQPELLGGRYPHELSGGMRQRVMIAIALACDPPLILADEPTTALDSTVQAQILDLLLALRGERGLAVLLVSHDLGVVGEVAQRILVMYAGQIVETATTEEILSNPRHPYTRLLLATSPRLDRPRRERFVTIPGTAVSPEEVPVGCAFKLRCPAAQTACTAPQELRQRGGPQGHLERCRRADELHDRPIARSGSA